MFAQVPDSIQQAISFYPLSDGDRWQYEFYLPSSDTYVHYFKIVGALVEQLNGKNYARVVHGSGTTNIYDFERVDTTTAVVYRYAANTMVDGQLVSEVPFLLLPTGEEERTWADNPDQTGGLTCGWAESRTVFEEEFRIWRCVRDNGTYVETVEMAAKLGVVYEHWDYEQPYELSLNYSDVSGEERGALVLTKVDSPVQPSNSFSMYPNPASAGSAVTVKESFAGHAVEVGIYDLLGRNVFRGSWTTATTEISLNVPGTLSSGTYLVVIQGRTVQTGTIVVIGK